MLEWLDTLSYATWVRESLYGWAIVLTLHAFGNAMVVGFIFLIGLRLIGMFRTIPYNSLNDALIPTIWIGFAIQLFSGFSLFLTKPTRYGADALFLTKMGFVLGGVILTLYFQKIYKAEVRATGPRLAPSPRVVQIGLLACFMWASVLIMGRLTAYLGQLYDV